MQVQLLLSAEKNRQSIATVYFFILKKQELNEEGGVTAGHDGRRRSGGPSTPTCPDCYEHLLRASETKLEAYVRYILCP